MPSIEDVVMSKVLSISRHFGVPPPRSIRIGCSGCPFYDEYSDRCRLGYIACYDVSTQTITFSKPVYAMREEVVLHELLHHVAETARSRGLLGYRIGVTGIETEPTLLATAIQLVATAILAVARGRKR